MTSRMFCRTAAALLATAALAGCSTYALPQYSPAPQTMAALKKLAPAKVSVGSMSGELAALTTISCRGTAPIKPPGSQSYGEYLRGALRDELLLAEVYDEKSPLKLSGTVNALDFSSGLSDATWKIWLTLASSNGQVMQASVNYTFDSSWAGETACNQAAQAGMGAVQSLLRSAVHDPKFGRLIR